MTRLTVTVRGPLFDKRIDKVVQDAIIAESLDKVAERIARPGRRIGRRRNTITDRRRGLILESTSTLRNPNVRRQRYPSFGSSPNRRPNPDFNPRATGRAWRNKLIGTAGFSKGIIGSMLPRVLRKTSDRIIRELG